MEYINLLRLLIRSKIRYLLVIPVIALIAVSVFGYMVVARGQTQYGEDLQNKIWQTIMDKGMNDARNMSASFKYTDTGKYKFIPSNFKGIFSEEELAKEELAELDKEYSFTVSKLNFGIEMNGYTDFTDSIRPKTDSHVEAWLGNNRKKYSASADLKLKDDEAFIKYDYSKDLNAQFSNIYGSNETDPTKNKWLQITDGYELDSIRQSLTSLINPEQNLDYERLLREHRLFDIKNLKGAKKINGKATLQYELTLNKSRLRNLISASLDLNFGGSDPADKEIAQEIMFALVDKIQIKEFNVWIGVTDQKLHKSTLTSNALSVSKTLAQFEKIINDPNNPVKKSVDQSLEQARSRSRDAKRLADIRQMASALELYYNDNNQYPPAQNGQPIGISPNYINEVPTEPTPADGNCTDYDNIYWYYRTSPTSYRYMFCLGDDTGGVKRGVAEMTENGFLNTVPLEDTFDEDEEMMKNAILDIIKNMNFDAKVQINYSAKDIGKSQKIQSPKKYIRAAANMYGSLKAAITPESSLFKFNK